MNFNLLELICVATVCFIAGFLFCAWLNGALRGASTESDDEIYSPSSVLILPPKLGDITPEQGRRMLALAEKWKKQDEQSENAKGNR